jgi:hypothetical protein
MLVSIEMNWRASLGSGSGGGFGGFLSRVTRPTPGAVGWSAQPVEKRSRKGRVRREIRRMIALLNWLESVAGFEAGAHAPRFSNPGKRLYEKMTDTMRGFAPANGRRA